MCCDKFLAKLISFVLALTIGLLTAGVLRREESTSGNQKNIKEVDKVIQVEKESGSGQSGSTKLTERKCFACSDGIFGTSLDDDSLKNARSETESVRLISKPRAGYTDAARQNQIEGTINLRVTFLSSGKIGSVSPITNLPDGLTEQAITAAKNIRFQPALRDGKPFDTTKIVQYSFTIY